MVPKNAIKRRTLLQLGATGLLPALLPDMSWAGANRHSVDAFAPADKSRVKFIGDGELFEPEDYVSALAQLSLKNDYGKDVYGAGGAVAALEKKMATLTGKQAAIFMPTGTMANQLAMAVLSGNKAKIFVQDLSHIYRDEADAAQTVFQKRLMPLGLNKHTFELQELKEAITNLPKQEVFYSGIGAVAIECPVRRANGQFVPIETIKAIRRYCMEKKIPMHLDGARLLIASAWSGISVKEYSEQFDTVYISLYKYLGASAGAVLCGPAEIIDQMPHLIKVHGGAMFGNWANAAMALHRLEKFDERLAAAKASWATIAKAIEQIPGASISAPENGSNIYFLHLPKTVDREKFQTTLRDKFDIQVLQPDNDNRVVLFVNETLVKQSTTQIIEAFTTCMA